MSLFKANKTRNAVKRFAKGMLACDECGARHKLEDLAPLALAPCRKCATPNFVPLHVAGFWAVEPLGGGGSGSVYRAYHLKSKTSCAIKLLHREERDNEKVIADLQKETEILSAIGPHPFIRQVVSGGFADGEHYCALNFIEGERLDDHVERLTCVPERDMLRIVLNLLSAERHICEKGYLYRDMKPENIILREDGHPVLIDFGFCLTAEQAASPAPSAFVDGSPFYLPPERLWRSGENLASEIYSLGMVLFYGLTGTTFFKSAASAEELALKHISSVRFTVNAKIMPQCSARVIELVDKMIQRDPADRLQSFEAVGLAIRRCLK